MLFITKRLKQHETSIKILRSFSQLFKLMVRLIEFIMSDVLDNMLETTKFPPLELFCEKFYRFSDYLGTTSQMSELLGISSISGILRFGRYPAYHGISEPHLAVKSSKTVVENRPYY